LAHAHGMAAFIAHRQMWPRMQPKLVPSWHQGMIEPQWRGWEPSLPRQALPQGLAVHWCWTAFDMWS
jgi:hypothetical protein